MAAKKTRRKRGPDDKYEIVLVRRLVATRVGNSEQFKITYEFDGIKGVFNENELTAGSTDNEGGAKHVRELLIPRIVGRQFDGDWNWFTEPDKSDANKPEVNLENVDLTTLSDHDLNELLKSL